MKSIKLKNNNFWDSESIMHCRVSLKELLTSITNRIVGYGTVAETIEDPDTIGLKSGFYQYNGNYGSALPHNWYFIIHLAHYDVNGNYCRQVWFDLTSNVFYTRIQVSGAWRRFSTS